MTAIGLASLSAALYVTNGFIVALGTSIQIITNYTSYNDRLDLARLEYQLLRDTRETLLQRVENDDQADSIKAAFTKTNVLLDKASNMLASFDRPPPRPPHNGTLDSYPSSDLMMNKLKSHGRAQISNPLNRPFRLPKLLDSQ
jgi:hypothetical protein